MDYIVRWLRVITPQELPLHAVGEINFVLFLKIPILHTSQKTFRYVTWSSDKNNAWLAFVNQY